MDLASLISAVRLQAESAMGAAANAQSSASTLGISGAIGSATLSSADQAALLANPAVAYQIQQNPLLAASLLQHARAAASMISTGPSIDPDVQDLADHYGLDERITKQLDEEMKKRPVTFEGDLLALWDILKDARSPAGLLQVKIGEMQANTFIGQPTMDKDVKELQRKYKLDDQATRKLAEVLQRRSETREQDVELMHRHLETSNKPSARVMMILGKLKPDEPLPEADKRIAPGSYLDKLEREKERSKEDKDRRHSGRDRDRDRDPRRSRSRDRRRSRSRDRDRRK